MTQDEIIRMALEAGVMHPAQQRNPDLELALERFAALVAAHEREKCFDAAMKAAEKAVDTAMLLEREACAKLCLETDVHPDHGDVAGDFLAGHIWGCEDCAAAIRARGNHA